MLYWIPLTFAIRRLSANGPHTSLLCGHDWPNTPPASCRSSNRSNFSSCMSKRHTWNAIKEVSCDVVTSKFSRMSVSTLSESLRCLSSDGSPPHRARHTTVMNLLLKLRPSFIYCSRVCLRRQTPNCGRLRRKMFPCFSQNLPSLLLPHECLHSGVFNEFYFANVC